MEMILVDEKKWDTISTAAKEIIWTKENDERARKYEVERLEKENN